MPSVLLIQSQLSPNSRDSALAINKKWMATGFQTRLSMTRMLNSTVYGAAHGDPAESLNAEQDQQVARDSTLETRPNSIVAVG